jgi:hypothetical protein
MFFKPARLEVFYEQLEQLGEDEVRKLIAQGAFAGNLAIYQFSTDRCWPGEWACDSRSPPSADPRTHVVDGLTRLSDSISAALKQRLPRQRKTQREKLALLIGTMLDVRSANLMDLAAGLPLEVDRTDMRGLM